MDDDTRDLITLLCTRIGMLMEDLSAAALTVGLEDLGRIGTVIDDLSRGADQIAALAEAARSLLEQGG